MGKQCRFDGLSVLSMSLANLKPFALYSNKNPTSHCSSRARRVGTLSAFDLHGPGQQRDGWHSNGMVGTPILRYHGIVASGK